MSSTRWCIVCMLVVAGCAASETGSGSAYVVRDSAGVGIVESRRALWSEGGGWRVNPEPAVAIGVVDGEDAYVLAMVRGATRLGDGTIVIVNGGTSELRAYDADGRHRWTAGRRGGGPGEFEFPDRVLRLSGDTLLAADVGLQRVSLFDASGAFVRSWQLSGNVMPRAVLGDGTLVAQRSKLPDTYGVVRVPQHLVRFDDGGTRAVELDEITSSLLYLEQVGRGVRNNLLPFQPMASMAAHADGVYAGNGERYEIHDFDSAGTLRRTIRVLQPNRPATSELAAAVIDEALANVPEARRTDARRVLEAAPRLPEVPAFVELIVDGDGHVWTRQWALAPDPAQWHVFHPEGHLLGPVQMPAGLRVLEIGADYVLGIVRDDLDVEQVRVHRLNR